MSPCLVARLSFLPADTMPCLRRYTTAASMSPSVATSAFLHSIIPAPVRSRSFFTSCALISAIYVSYIHTTNTGSREPPGCTDSLLFADRGGRDGLFGGRLAARALTRRCFRFATGGEALRHELLLVFRIQVLREFFGS